MIATSNKEAQELGLRTYFTGKPCSRGHVAPRCVNHCTCVACRDECGREWRRNNYERYLKNARRQQSAPDAKAKRLVWSQKDRAENPEKYRQWMSDWFYANRDRAKELGRKNRARNPEKYRAKGSEQYVLRNSAIPTWLTKEHRSEIEALHKEARRLEEKTGVPHHVDHIVPIKHKDVCGLHVPWNLRVITRSENVRKKNKLIESLIIGEFACPTRMNTTRIAPSS